MLEFYRGGVLLWTGKKQGVPPILEDIYDNIYISCGDVRYYSTDISVSRDKRYVYPKAVYYENYVDIAWKYVDISFKSSDRNVIDDYGTIIWIGKCKFTVTVRLKNPDSGYTKNEINKVFNITVT